MRKLFFQACATEGVDVVGSTPYIESTVKLSKQNISWIVDVGNWILHFPFSFHSWKSKIRPHISEIKLEKDSHASQKTFRSSFRCMHVLPSI